MDFLSFFLFDRLPSFSVGRFAFPVRGVFLFQKLFPKSWVSLGIFELFKNLASYSLCFVKRRFKMARILLMLVITAGLFLIIRANAEHGGFY